MYEQFYGFRERPFSLLPDPDFLFLGNKHQTALDLIELTIFNQAGFCVVSGDIGAGKTTLIRELLNRLDDDICVGLISNTHPSFGELLQWIMAAFGLTCDSGDQFELHRRFLDFVIQQYADNKRTLLIIDEAQNLSVSAMEELRMLSNVNSDKDLVLQVILVGQNQLRDKLQLPEMEQFAQRIAVDHHLTGLDEKETCDYIQYRVTHAGGSADLFSEDSCRTVYRCSDGIPRLINGICDLCLVYGYSDKSRVITPELVREVVKDQRIGHIRTPAGNLSQQAGDVAMTAFASTLAGGARFIEHNSTARPKPEPTKADMPVGQIPVSQEKITTLEKAATEVNRKLASSGTAPETIVGSMERMLRQEAVNSKAAGLAQHTVTDNDSAGLPRRHGLVVEAEQSANSVNKQRIPAAFRLVMGLVLLMGAGATGWLTWLLWDETPVAETIADHPSDSAVPSTAVNVPVIDPLTQESTNKRAEQREAERLERERQAAEKRLAEQREAERLARERQEAEKRLAEQREAERLERERQEAEKRLAELQREAERLAREQQEAEKRLAEQREAERLERERQAAEKQLAEQREAERDVAKRPEVTRQAKQTSIDASQRIVSPVPKTSDRSVRDAELEAKRAAALAAWNKANSGIGWAEETEDEEEEE
jgi:type II secretory pathway predicted ATPase ExeA